MKRKIGLYIGMLLVLIMPAMFMACSDNGAAEKELVNKQWTLSSFGGPLGSINLLPGTAITIEFSDEDNSLSGSSGCNTYFGSYEIEGNQITIGEGIAVTERHCEEPAGVMDQEQTYLNFLGSAESFKIENGQLTLTCGDQLLTYQDK